jgi:hypothetical protein
MHTLTRYRDIRLLIQYLLPRRVETFHSLLNLIDLNLLAKEQDYYRFTGNPEQN